MCCSDPVLKAKKARKDIDVDDFLNGGFEAVQADSDASSQGPDDAADDADSAQDYEDDELDSDADELIDAAAADTSESDSEGLINYLAVPAACVIADALDSTGTSTVLLMLQLLLWSLHKPGEACCRQHGDSPGNLSHSGYHGCRA